MMPTAISGPLVVCADVTPNPRTYWIRARFEQAIREHVRVRPMERITVRCLCARTGLGRHTFFQIYASLDEAKSAAARGGL
jgi:hypothetical protein